MGVEAHRPTDEGLAKKFRTNAEIVLSERNTISAIDAIMNLEKLGDASALMEVLVD